MIAWIVRTGREINHWKTNSSVAGSGSIIPLPAQAAVKGCLRLYSGSLPGPAVFFCEIFFPVTAYLHYPERLRLRYCAALFFEAGKMAKGKYQHWLTKEGLIKIEGWARDGLSEEQIARNMGISRSTLKEWKIKYPAIMARIKKGREVVVRELENALIKRALGYETTEEISELRYDKEQGKEVMKVTRTTKKTVPPDVGALAFALKNMAADKWRDRQDVEVSGLSGEQSRLYELLEQRKRRRNATQ